MYLQSQREIGIKNKGVKNTNKKIKKNNKKRLTK